VIPFIPQPRLDSGAIDLFFRVGEFTESRTPIEGLEVLPPGTEYRDVRGTAPSSRVYWKLRHRGEKELQIETAASELSARLTAAVRRVESVYPRLITPLSGGLDSRLILGLCRHPERVPSVTWGDSGCRDLEYAEAFAARIGSPHQSLPFEPDAFVARWTDGVEATGGCFPVRDMFILPFAPGLAGRADVALNGLAGDVFLGGNFLKNSWMQNGSLASLAGEAWRWRVSAEDEEMTASLTRDTVKPGDARESWIRSITGHGEGRPIEVLVDWLLENRIFRFTNCGSMLLRTAIESYSPFFDRDVVDFLVRVPLEYRMKHRLYLQVLAKACPPAAEIPWQRTAIPPRWGYPAALASLAWHRVLRGIGKRLGFVPFPGERVASPADWFRGPWAAPVREILFSDRALARKVVNPDALRRLWDTHQAGRDLSRALGALVAIELFCRRFLDRLRVPGEGKAS
jgi:asparagine synthase (glutamine-hydrolysing)